MKIIDCHTHIFPTKIAARASENIGGFYSLPMKYDGTVEALVNVCNQNGISKCLVNSVATTAAQVHSINSFISDTVRENGDLFFGFAALHPAQSKAELEQEIAFVREQGLCGVKLHPDFQEFAIDDRGAYHIYERLEGELPLLLHTGDNRYYFSNPKRLKTVLRDFPKLVVIAAHFGGWSEWDDAVHTLADTENVYVDTSSSLYALSKAQATDCINAFSPERVLFGTDYPMWDASDELAYIDRLDLPEATRAKILHQNAEKLFF